MKGAQRATAAAAGGARSMPRQDQAESDLLKLSHDELQATNFVDQSVGYDVVLLVRAS